MSVVLDAGDASEQREKAMLLAGLIGMATLCLLGALGLSALLVALATDKADPGQAAIAPPTIVYVAILILIVALLVFPLLGMVGLTS